MILPFLQITESVPVGVLAENISIGDILSLPIDERIRLVEEIWDSIAAEIEHAPLNTRTQSPEMAPMSLGSLVLSTSKPGRSRLVTSILATHVPKGPSRGRLIAHLRPHRNPRDVAIQTGSAVSFI